MIVRVDTLGVQEAGKSSNDNAHEQKYGRQPQCVNA